MSFMVRSTPSIGFSYGGRSRFQHQEVLPLPENSEPLLMLEGDCFHLSVDGVGRTAYLDSKSGLVVEEQYQIERAQKIFMLRKSLGFENENKGSKQQEQEKRLNIGPSICGCKLQEIDYKNIFEGAGTGVTTWESSIAMSFYFVNNPNDLSGNVLELGSGVGLGGLLSLKALKYCASHKHNKLDSFTFTDGSNDVVSQCQENVREAPDIDEVVAVRHLDWNDPIPRADKQSYSTIIASDVIYLFPDIEPIAATINDLLHTSGKFHMFAPVHRSTIRRISDELKEKYNFVMKREIIDLSRFRLVPYSDDNDFSKRFFLRQTSSTCEESCLYASQELSQFVHLEFSRGDIRRLNQNSLLNLD